ncbi:hypothetical protein COLO4_08825 [Corchorus olitorius]|uniref:Helitron helicase-like domain-containing protein n=1 Tax=Corchorus olitorius TaxID=93759 RepID=A0A1R3KEF6_9ROSI|nr:hypothetical protein COLO4_08825 [Corchorus olitorius]
MEPEIYSPCEDSADGNSLCPGSVPTTPAPRKRLRRMSVCPPSSPAPMKVHRICGSSTWAPSNSSFVPEQAVAGFLGGSGSVSLSYSSAGSVSRLLDVPVDQCLTYAPPLVQFGCTTWSNSDPAFFSAEHPFVDVPILSDLDISTPAFVTSCFPHVVCKGDGPSDPKTRQCCAAFETSGLVDVPIQFSVLDYAYLRSSSSTSPGGTPWLNEASGTIGMVRLRRGRKAGPRQVRPRFVDSGLRNPSADDIDLASAHPSLSPSHDSPDVSVHRASNNDDPDLESSVSSDGLGASSSVGLASGHKRTCYEPTRFGAPDVVCPNCGAYMWIDESVSRGQHPIVQFPLPVYVFGWLNNQTYHQIGPLLPPDGSRPRFAQLYIYDCENEVSNRVRAVTGGRSADGINRLIVEGLMVMFDSCNEVVKLFRMAKERIDVDRSKPVRIRLLRSRGCNPRTYALPTTAQIGGLIVGDFGRSDGDRDVIVEHQNGMLGHISIVHPLYMALQYPILFPFGEDGFTPNMRYAGSAASSGNIHQTLSMQDYYSYQIRQRSRQCETLLRGSRLFQQFCVDVLSFVSEGELLWLDNHQNDIMADLYSNVRDLVHRGDVDVSAVGKRIILPASFTGSPRYLYQKYQDAMAICRAYGYPDLFITFTCNGNWPKLQDAFSYYPGLRPEDRPDLVARVFHIKQRHFLDVLIKRGHSGPALAVTYTVEFQKRGLPHAHILLWLQPSAKLKTPADIDKYVSAEIPDPDVDSIGYEAVTSFMMHGPCGAPNPRAPCMEGQKCNKYFPKSFTQKTRIDSQGYLTYRRRDTGVFCVKSGVVLDNRRIAAASEKFPVTVGAEIPPKCSLLSPEHGTVVSSSRILLGSPRSNLAETQNRDLRSKDSTVHCFRDSVKAKGTRWTVSMEPKGKKKGAYAECVLLCICG